MKRIRVKLKIWMLWKNITIAFRPVYLIAFSFSLMIVFDAVMIAIMSFYSDADLIYKICSKDLMQVAFDDFEVGEKYIIDEDEEDSEKDSDKAEESINFDNESIISGALKRILEEIDILESEAEKMPSGFFVHFEKNELKRQKKKIPTCKRCLAIV